ncbi:hypothetical protein L3Q82_004491 [Scortum barcoo]|uniref:Uncharacterized protein n=1 Tax=Scortum barcoo TaxID=214431 RepID=A0ACB8VKD8_9TELE|nr:hypothetical protein L3Q82_004491 [Scortum barcoo]
MAKVSKNKMSKKKLKKTLEVTDRSAAVRPDVLYDDEEEEEEEGLTKADENITSEEEEENGVEDERKRQKLLEAISALNEGEGDKVDLSDLIGTMDKTPALPTKAKKQLKNLQQSKKTIECPLSKQESERIQRDVAFQKAATEEPSGPKPMERVPINDPILTPVEEASIRAMSLEEAKIRRAELQKARALQSYYEAKARRERKIKSKKYHKVHNKAKHKEFLKQFDEMHQNSGKWAKSKAIMAKYDEGARKAMQQQLEVNKELTQKLVTSLNNEEEEEEEQAGHAEVLPDFVNDAEQGLGEGPGLEGNKVDEEKDEEQGETDTLPVISVDDDDEKEEEEEEEEEQKAAAEEEELSEFTNLFRGIADGHQESEAEKAETTAEASCTDTSAQLEEELMRIRTLEDMELLSQEESSNNKAPVQPQQPPTTENLPPATQKASKNKKRKRGIELKEVLTKETNVIQVPLAPTIEDTEDSDEKLDQRGLIKEAFAGDDVISDFLKDKRKQEDAGKPKVVDLTLPGWGEWGGTGLKPSHSKRRRFRIKTAPPPPRKDHHLPSVIISEKRNSSISPHQVNSLPFPFENHAQFESTIRSPLGRTWNTERTAKKVSKPKVVTQLGAIIEPMAREELMKDKKLVSAGNKNSLVICIIMDKGLQMSLTLTAMSDSAVTSGHQQWSGSRQIPWPSQGPYISVITNRTTNLVIRGAMLFSVGVFLALVLNLLQVQRNVTLFPPDVISSIFSSAWWVPPCCGTASALTLSHTGHWKFNMAPHGKELSEDLKKRIVALHKDGQGYKKIANTLKLSCSTVAKTIQRFNRTGSTQNRPRHGR